MSTSLPTTVGIFSLFDILYFFVSVKCLFQQNFTAAEYSWILSVFKTDNIGPTQINVQSKLYYSLYARTQKSRRSAIHVR